MESDELERRAAQHQERLHAAGLPDSLEELIGRRFTFFVEPPGADATRANPLLYRAWNITGKVRARRL